MASLDAQSAKPHRDVGMRSDSGLAGRVNHNLPPSRRRSNRVRAVRSATCGKPVCVRQRRHGAQKRSEGMWSDSGRAVWVRAALLHESARAGRTSDNARQCLYYGGKPRAPLWSDPAKRSPSP